MPASTPRAYSPFVSSEPASTAVAGDHFGSLLGQTTAIAATHTVYEAPEIRRSSVAEMTVLEQEEEAWSQPLPQLQANVSVRHPCVDVSTPPSSTSTVPPIPVQQAESVSSESDPDHRIEELQRAVASIHAQQAELHAQQAERDAHERNLQQGPRNLQQGPRSVDIGAQEDTGDHVRWCRDLSPGSKVPARNAPAYSPESTLPAAYLPPSSHGVGRQQPVWTGNDTTDRALFDTFLRNRSQLAQGSSRPTPNGGPAPEPYVGVSNSATAVPSAYALGNEDYTSREEECPRSLDGRAIHPPDHRTWLRAHTNSDDWSAYDGFCQWWVSFCMLPPSEQMAHYEDSPDRDHARHMLMAQGNESEEIWHRRGMYLERTIANWCDARMRCHKGGRGRSHGVSLDMVAKLRFPAGLRAGDNPVEMATAWDGFRLTVLRTVEEALVGVCEWLDILNRLLQASRDKKYGQSRIQAFIGAAIGDKCLQRNPVLHANVLIGKLDASFAEGVPMFSRETPSAAWDACISRLQGEDAETLGTRIIAAFLKKQGDPSLNQRTV